MKIDKVKPNVSFLKRMHEYFEAKISEVKMQLKLCSLSFVCWPKYTHL